MSMKSSPSQSRCPSDPSATATGVRGDGDRLHTQPDDTGAQPAMHPIVSVNRDSLGGLIRTTAATAHKQCVEADGEGACTMYAEISQQGYTLAARIETGRLADEDITAAVSSYVNLARKSGL
jgi:hypothetical protein